MNLLKKRRRKEFIAKTGQGRSSPSKHSAGRNKTPGKKKKMPWNGARRTPRGTRSQWAPETFLHRDDWLTVHRVVGKSRRSHRKTNRSQYKKSTKKATRGATTSQSSGNVLVGMEKAVYVDIPSREQRVVKEGGRTPKVLKVVAEAKARRPGWGYGCMVKGVRPLSTPM